MTRSGDLDGLVAVVTGGAAGIGAAITAELRGLGAAVAVPDVEAASADPDRFTCDVTDRAQVREAVAAVVDRHGRLDLVVNNAGISAVGTVEDNDDAQWHRVLDVNVVGTARVSAAALPALRRSPAAAIVNVCSIAALNGLPQRAIYSASKGAVLALTFAMAADHVHEGIRVNAVSPGTVHTAFVDRMLEQLDDPAAERAALEARQATGRMVTVDEVAAAVAYLPGPRAGSTTGTALEVDGGVTHLRVRHAR